MTFPLSDESHPRYFGVTIIFYRIFERELTLEIFLPFPIALLSTLHLTPYTLVFLFRIRFSLPPRSLSLFLFGFPNSHY